LRVLDAATLVEAGSAQAVATSAAAAGLRWGDLRAVIGTGAAAGSVAVENGTLRALGVPGELTADTAKAYVADWRGAGVFVSDAVDLIIDRTSAAGDLVVTAWVGAQGVIADPSRFLEVV
jgi:ribonucleotide monophosphatase NagD (HAD superfamily)